MLSSSNNPSPCANMDAMMNVNLQDGSSIEIATAGVRKPRSGSIRKPRSGAHSIVAFDQDPASSHSGSPSRPNSLNEGNGFLPRDPNSAARMLAEDAEVERSFERSRDLYKDTGESRGHSHSYRMGEGDDRNEVRMFQRRDRKREEEKSYNRDSSRPVSKSWKDLDAVDRSFTREENRRSGSPSHEFSKKQRDSSDKSDRPWKEKESSERRFKDGSHRDRNDHPSNSLWHKSKGNQPSRDTAHRDKGDHLWKDREYKDRPDHTPKEYVQRDRSEQAHANHKDWKSRGHSQERDYDKGEREGLFKSRSVNMSNETSERHFGSTGSERSGGASHRSSAMSTGGEQSSHAYDRDSPSLHKYASSTYQDKRGSAFHEATGPERVSESSHGTSGGDNRSLPKLKLKVGGITHTLHSDGKRQSDGSDSMVRTPHQSGPSLKKRSSSAPEPNRRRQRLILQEDSDEEEDILPTAKEHVPAEEDGFLAYLAEEPGYRRGSAGMGFDNNQNLQGVRKSSRIPKKRVFDGDDDGDVEPKRRRKKKVEIDSDEDLYRIEEDEIEHGFAEEEEEEIEMVNEAKLKFNKRRRKSLDSDFSGGDNRRAVSSADKLGVFNDSRTGVPLTARQRALQSSKEGMADVGATLIEFPEGLTHSAPKKQKEVLTAAERQLKKEEAAQKRRQQVEKAAKEIQASAIQKILCQDSQRKKREGKLQKQREEMEQEKKAAAMAPATNSIRWVLGPNGTEVSFSQDLELPKIFSGPLSYPQEREKCAGPSCTNAYRYRDSKTLLPLCSLQCYQAVQKKPSDAGLAH